MTDITFFVFMYMRCRISNIIPPCGYRPEGIAKIELLDCEDFKALTFDGGNYDSCYVTGVQHTGRFIEIASPDIAKYSSVLQNGIHTHVIDTFVGDLSAMHQAKLHTATKRRYLVRFITNTGGTFIYGYDAGATITFNNQTAEGIGVLVRITATSIHPLFEVMDLNIYWTDYINIWQYVEADVACQWAHYINIWKEVCVNDFSIDFSIDFNCNSPVKSSKWSDYINLWSWVDPNVQSQWGAFINIWQRICYDDYNADFNTDFSCSSPTEPYIVISTPNVWLQNDSEDVQQIGIQSNTDWIIE